MPLATTLPRSLLGWSADYVKYPVIHPHRPVRTGTFWYSCHFTKIIISIHL
jgi:hypothetical protein